MTACIYTWEPDWSTPVAVPSKHISVALSWHVGHGMLLPSHLHLEWLVLMNLAMFVDAMLQDYKLCVQHSEIPFYWFVIMIIIMS